VTTVSTTTRSDGQETGRSAAAGLIPRAALNDAGYEVAVSRQANDGRWDAFLQDIPGAYFAQSSLWAQVKAQQGYEPLRLTVSRQGRIVAGAQLLVRPLQGKGLPGLGYLGYASRGPVLAEDDPFMMRETLAALTATAGRAGIRALIAQPHGHGQGPVDLLAGAGFRPTQRTVAPVHTLLLDLEPDIADIMAQFKSRTRYNIRVSGRKDIVVRDGGEEDLEQYSHLATLTGQRQGFSVPSYAYYRRLWQILAPAGQAKLFLAEYEGELIAAQLAIAFGDTVVNRMTVWGGREGKRKPNEGLMWAAIQWAKEYGYRYYDFGGLSPKGAMAYETGADLPEELKGTVTSFKLGFGGQIVSTPGAYFYVGNRFMRLVDRHLVAKIEDSKQVKKLANRLRTS
jgi:lipid II:glycine glycyltransferase (peptidoglycan interpeptide bridge formation enzyme)